MNSFTEFDLEPRILNALSKKGYQTPTPIQQQAIPPALQGRDILGCAQTGTGKTGAFAIPILQRLHQSFSTERPCIKVLVVAPTRELATQIEESFALYGRGLGFRQAVIFGGVRQTTQIQKLRRGVDILIATPGRLLDLCKQGHIRLDQIKMFVLDEADHMLDMGFIHDAKKIVALLPENRQSFFFSATMPKTVLELAQRFLNRPEKVEVTPVSSTAETVSQKLFMVDKDKKRDLLTHLLKELDVPSVLIFTRTKHGANKLAKFISETGDPAEAIHANKSQVQREKALKNFKSKKTRVLIATDIASRGIDIVELPLVINFDIPNEAETYVHRIGRTGRAEKTGSAFSFCSQEELSYMRDIHKLIGNTVPVETEHPYPASYEVMAVRPSAPPKKKLGNKPATSEKKRKKPFHGKSSGPSSTSSAPRRRTGEDRVNAKESRPPGGDRTSDDRNQTKKRTYDPLRNSNGSADYNNRKSTSSFSGTESRSRNTETKDNSEQPRRSAPPSKPAFRPRPKSAAGKTQNRTKNKAF